MTKSFLMPLIGALLLWASAAHATPACGSNVPYSDWVDTTGFSCTVGDETFSGFSFFSETGMKAGDITVGPDTGAPAGSVGLLFSTPTLKVVGTGREDNNIGFTVSSSGAARITDARLKITGAITGTGTASVGADLSNTSTLLTVEVPTPPIADVTFSPTQSLHLLTGDCCGNNALVDGVSGTTSISTITTDFSETTKPQPPPSVPEPSTLALFGTAVLGLGVIGNRRRKRG